MNAPDILKYGHKTVLDTLEGLPESEISTSSVCGIWSVKDIVAHLASYELFLQDVLYVFLGEQGETPYFTEMTTKGPEIFNDNQVGARQSKSYAETLGEYQLSHAKNLETISKIPAEKLRQAGTLPWYGAEYDLDDFLVYTFYGHKREHAAQIAVFKDKISGKI